MKRFREIVKGVVMFVALFAVLVGSVAAMRELFTVTKMQVQYICGLPRETNDTITVKAPIVFQKGTTFNEGVTYSGTVAVVGTADVGALNFTQSGATAIVNGGTGTLTYAVTRLLSQGSPNLTTNTIVLARPTSAGVRYILNDPNSSNLIAIASSGAWNGAALELAAGESAIAVGYEDLDGVGTNAWDGQEL